MQTEGQLHRAVAGLLNKSLRPPAWFTTFPAGGGGADRGRELKEKGMKPGVPDILIVYCGRLYGIELKAEKGVISESQHECHAELRNCGVDVIVCRTKGQVISALTYWQIPMSKQSRSSELLEQSIARWNASQTKQR